MHGTWKVTGGGGRITAGGVIVLALIVWGYIEIAPHAHAVGRTATATLDAVAIGVGALAGLTVLVFGTICAVAVYRRVSQLRPQPAQPGMDVAVPGAEPVRVAGLPVG